MSPVSILSRASCKRRYTQLMVIARKSISKHPTPARPPAHYMWWVERTMKSQPISHRHSLTQWTRQAQFQPTLCPCHVENFGRHPQYRLPIEAIVYEVPAAKNRAQHTAFLPAYQSDDWRTNCFEDGYDKRASIYEREKSVSFRQLERNLLCRVLHPFWFDALAPSRVATDANGWSRGGFVLYIKSAKQYGDREG